MKRTKRMRIIIPDKEKIFNHDSIKYDFYARYLDIAQELTHYSRGFRRKVVLCNCDDPKCSNFTIYFKKNFKDLKLRKLICTTYKHKNLDLFQSQDKSSNQAMAYIYDGEHERIINLQGNGDFRSDECLKYLEECDIVVTAPPFDLFNQYINTVIRFNKKFLVIGDQSIVNKNEIIELIRKKNMWLGHHKRLFGMYLDDKANFADEPPLICSWFTNLSNSDTSEKITSRTKQVTKQSSQYRYQKNTSTTITTIYYNSIMGGTEFGVYSDTGFSNVMASSINLTSPLIGTMMTSNLGSMLSNSLLLLLRLNAKLFGFLGIGALSQQLLHVQPKNTALIHKNNNIGLVNIDAALLVLPLSLVMEQSNIHRHAHNRHAQHPSPSQSPTRGVVVQLSIGDVFDMFATSNDLLSTRRSISNNLGNQTNTSFLQDLHRLVQNDSQSQLRSPQRSRIGRGRG